MGLLVQGTVPGQACLELPMILVCNLSLEIEASDPRAGFVPPLLDQDAVLDAYFREREHIGQIGEESLHKQIALPGSPGVVHIGRKAEVLRLLHPQIVSEPYH